MGRFSHRHNENNVKLKGLRYEVWNWLALPIQDFETIEDARIFLRTLKRGVRRCDCVIFDNETGRIVE